MKLTVATPLDVVTDVEGVAHLRAEDDTGAFGILPGHADFLTSLPLSVVTWRGENGGEHHLAVRGGMLEIRDGDRIRIAAREAVPGDNLHDLETGVLADFRRRTEEERRARTDAERLYFAAVQQILRFLKSEREV
jgi:F-type H+-transporting ATPase subunit epsilon